MMGTLGDMGAYGVGLRLEKGLKLALTAAMRGLYANDIFSNNFVFARSG
jgi:hypothetical protein